MIGHHGVRHLAFGFVALVALVALLAVPSSAEAGFRYRIEPGAVTLGVGQSQQFTIYLDAEAGSVASVLGFNVLLELYGDTQGVGFTAGDRLPNSGPTPGTPYIFSGNTGVIFSAEALNLDGSPSSFLPNGSLAISLSDSTEDFPNPTVLDGGLAGASWMIGAVTITNIASPGGTVTIRFNEDVSGLIKELIDDKGVKVEDVTYQNGTFNLNGGGNVNVVPAPPAVVMALTGCVGLLAGRLRRRATAPAN